MQGKWIKGLRKAGENQIGAVVKSYTIINRQTILTISDSTNVTTIPFSKDTAKVK